MKNYLAIFLTIMIAAGLFFSSNPTPVYAREKSSVLLIYNNQAGKYYNKKLDAIAEEALHKKIDVIYNVVDNKEYQSAFAEPHFQDAPEALLEKTASCSAKYFIYVELMPFKTAENFNFIWHTKKTTATVGLRIFNLQERKEIFNQKYSVQAKDQTDYFVIGNPSMAKKSLKAVLFKVGEAISTYLPL